MDASILASDLKKVDPDRYLLSLFAPKETRPALWALYMFNAELVRTRAAVTDMNLGLIRLQWWRDEIHKLYIGGTGGQTPVLSTLAPLIHKGHLPHEWFEALLYAREFDLEDVAPANWDGLRNYADFTTTPLNQLGLRIVNQTANQEEIRHISINYGLMEAMRSVPLLLSQHRNLLPEDELVAQNLNTKKIIDHNHKKEIIEILRSKQKLFVPYRKPESWYLRNQQRLTFIYLNWLAKNDFDVFSPKLQGPPPFLALRLALS